MTDEEWLQVLEKKFQVLKFFTSPVRAYCRGKGRMHICYCEMCIIGHNFDNFSCVALICNAADDTVFNFRKSAFEVREMTRHPIIEFFR